MGDFNSKSSSESIITGKLPTMRTISRIPEYGKSHPDVKVVKVALNEIFGSKLDVENEYYGDSTKKVISELQLLEGMKGTGNLGPKTIELLRIQVKAEEKPVASGRHQLPPDYVELKKLEGMKETDPKLVAKLEPHWKDAGLPHFKGLAGSARAWCALIMVATAIWTGVKHGSATARSYDRVGVAVEWKTNGIPEGAWVRINSSANCSTDKGNHVTKAAGDCAASDIIQMVKVTKKDKDGKSYTAYEPQVKAGATFEGLGGNQGNMVKVSTYKVANICSVRWDDKKTPLPGKILVSYKCGKNKASDESTR